METEKSCGGEVVYKRRAFCIYFPYRRCGELSCFSCEPVSGKVVACRLFCGGSGFTQKSAKIDLQFRSGS